MAKEVVSEKNKDIAEKKFDQMSDLIERMQADEDLVNLVAKYKKIPDVNDKEIENSVYITLNDAAAFAWGVETQLNSATEQVSVTSDNKSFDTKYVEDFIEALFKEADNLLALKDMFPFEPFVDQQSTRRGRAAARCLCQFMDDELVPDITPYDTRYFAYWMGKKGYAGSAYKTTRSKDQIESEYSEVKLGEKSDASGYEVLDIWVPKSNEVWIDGANAKVQPSPFDYVPAVFYKVPMGSMLLSKDSLVNQGESIFFLIRDLLPELNRLVSIIQSMNLKALDSALQLEVPVEEAKSFPVKGKDEVSSPSTVNVVPTGKGYFSMPVEQLQQQAELLHRMIQDRINKGTSSTYQNILQPKTATEIIQLAQEKGDMSLPRLGTRGLLKQGLAEMAIRQTIQMAKSEKITKFKLGSRDDWDVAKIDGEFDIEYKYFFKDPQMDIARASVAASQKGILSDYTIRRTTYQLEDPEGEEALLYWESASVESALVRKGRTIEALLKDAEKGNIAAMYEAISMIPEYVAMAKQSMSGQMLENRAETPKPTQPNIPLTAGIGR